MTSEDELMISGVEISADGIAISYARVPKDIRKNGLMWQHNVMVPTGSDYDDEIEEFLVALKALLNDVLDDEDTAEPIDMDDETELEEEADDDEV